jgi:hypothetical protein
MTEKKFVYMINTKEIRSNRIFLPLLNNKLLNINELNYYTLRNNFLYKFR